MLKNKKAIMGAIFVFSLWGNTALATGLEELEKRLEDLEIQALQLRQDIAQLKQKEKTISDASTISPPLSSSNASPSASEAQNTAEITPEEESKILKNSKNNLYSKGKGEQGDTVTSLTAKIQANPYYKPRVLNSEPAPSATMPSAANAAAQSNGAQMADNMDNSPQLSASSSTAPSAEPPAAAPLNTQENNAKNALLTTAIAKVQSGQFTEGQEALSAYVSDGNNPNVGTAYYWLGKTYYQQKDYKKSAESFIQSYKMSKDTPLGPDVLLNLSLSLVQLDEREDACKVLLAIGERYPDESVKISMANEERKNLNCAAD